MIIYAKDFMEKTRSQVLNELNGNAELANLIIEKKKHLDDSMEMIAAWIYHAGEDVDVDDFLNEAEQCNKCNCCTNKE